MNTSMASSWNEPAVVGALERAGVRRANVKAPAPIPDVNAYLIGEGDVTVLDTGPLWRDSLEVVTAAVGKGSAVRQVLVTHGHLDHHGQAAALRAAYGCAVMAHPFDAFPVKEHTAALVDRFDRWSKAAAAGGAPTVLINALARRYEFLESLGADLDAVHLIDEGASIKAGDLTLEVIHVPGHTAGSLAFLDRRHRLLFSGDTVLSGITPNPFFEGVSDRASGPAPFLKSVERLAALPVDLVLPGHGPPVRDLPTLAAQYAEHHRQRRAAICDALRAKGPLTPFELVAQLFPGASALDQWLAVAEVLGHLQYLEALGEVEPAAADTSAIRYQLVRR